ncbi:hypothetical protein [Nannocystis pusilla]|uniref:hypothetical protein n=1 Tax=Nannocystis pusilla TaxID=889268 RepID=UPI003BF36110
MKFSPVTRNVPLLGLTLVFALGCPLQTDAGSDSDGDTTTAGTTDTDGAPTTTETTGPAVDEPMPCEGEAPALNAGAIAPPDPDEPTDIALRLSNEAITCEKPTAESLECAGDWSVSIQIPADIQAPGLYDLSDLGTLAITGHEACDGASGGNLRGTLEILAIDATEVEVRLCHLEGKWVDENPTVGTDFRVVAPRCSE